MASDNSLRTPGLTPEGERIEHVYRDEATYRLSMTENCMGEAMRLLDEARMQAQRGVSEAREYERLAGLRKQEVSFPMANYYDLFNSLSSRLDRVRGRVGEQRNREKIAGWKKEVE